MLVAYPTERPLYRPRSARTNRAALGASGERSRGCSNSAICRAATRRRSRSTACRWRFPMATWSASSGPTARARRRDRAPRHRRACGAAHRGALAGQPAARAARRRTRARPAGADPRRAVLGPGPDRHRRHGAGGRAPGRPRAVVRARPTTLAELFREVVSSTVTRSSASAYARAQGAQAVRARRGGPRHGPSVRLPHRMERFAGAALRMANC